MQSRTLSVWLYQPPEPERSGGGLAQTPRPAHPGPTRRYDRQAPAGYPSPAPAVSLAAGALGPCTVSI